MIRVTIELVSANTGKTSKLGEMLIANDGTGSVSRGNYIARVLRKASNSKDWEKGSYWNQRKHSKEGIVTNYPRQALVIWKLVLRALRSCYPEEK